MKVKLRIGIDVFCGFDILSKENGNSGILTYAQRLIYSLLAINEEEKNDIILFQKKGCTSVHGKNVYMRFVSTKEVLNPRSAEWERCYLAEAVNKENIDCFFSPNFVLPANISSPGIVMIHDIYYYFDPYDYEESKYYYLKKWVPISAKEAAKIITGSYASKSDIIKYLEVPENKVEVTYLAPGDEFSAINKEKAKSHVRDKYGINEPFILYVGSAKRRKNINNLIMAYLISKNKYHLKHKLVMVSEYINQIEEKRVLLERLGIKIGYDLICINDLTEKELVFLYNAADLFVFPSLYEGFGLVIIEAMACGLPVLTSNRGATSEIAGDAAVLVNPLNPEEIAYKMAEILTNKELINILREKSLKRAAQFSWRKTAKQTMDIFKATCYN